MNLMIMKCRRIVTLILILSIFLSGCHRTQQNVPISAVTGSVEIAADESLKPLLNAELDVFHSMYAYSSIDCKFVSESDAINLILQQKIFLAIVTRPLKLNETDFLKSKGILAESIPIAYDAIAIIVHKSNMSKALTIDQISNILSGKINNWKDIKGSSIEGNIEQLFDFKSSGVLRSLNDTINLNGKISGNITFSESSEKTIEMVANNPNSIGFVGFNLLSESDNSHVKMQLEKLNVLAISDQKIANNINCYVPSLSNLMNKRYPLMRIVYAIYADPSAGLSKGFLSHLTSERGQKIIYRMGLKPESDFQRLIKIKTD